MKKRGAEKEGGGAERRAAKRRPIVDSFGMFIVIPSKGPHRLPVHDVSEIGIGFDLDLEGEAAQTFPAQRGQKIDVRLYLNQSLYLPLSVSVARVETSPAVRRVGAQFDKDAEQNGKGYRAFRAFVDMIDAVIEAGELSAA
jgi:hypothetical protein